MQVGLTAALSRGLTALRRRPRDTKSRLQVLLRHPRELLFILLMLAFKDLFIVFQYLTSHASYLPIM